MWNFVSPRIVFGEGAISILDQMPGKRALIVTDAGVNAAGLTDIVKAHLSKNGIETELFAEVETDPSLETAIKAAAFAREVTPDLVIGLGGGSPIDVAKAAWVLYERPDLELDDINPLVRNLGLRKKARLITIPTTSGTGAEATWAIVLTDNKEQRKVGLGNREAGADLAIVDPVMACGMPPRLTADTGLDALTHAVEGYTCRWHTDFTDGLCLNAAKAIYDFLPKAVANGNDMEARERLHNAATCAGLGFGNSMASMAHAMGHALGAALHVHHGRAVSLFLPYTIEFAAAAQPERYATMARFLGCTGASARADGNLASAIRDLCRSVGNPTCVKEAGISEFEYKAKLDKLVDDSLNDTQMVTIVRPPGYEELRQLFQYAYDGSPVDF